MLRNLQKRGHAIWRHVFHIYFGLCLLSLLPQSDAKYEFESFRIQAICAERLGGPWALEDFQKGGHAIWRHVFHLDFGVHVLSLLQQPFLKRIRIITESRPEELWPRRDL